MKRYYKVNTMIDGYHIPTTQIEFDGAVEFFSELGKAADRLILEYVDFDTSSYEMWVHFGLHEEEQIGVAFYIEEEKKEKGKTK